MDRLPSHRDLLAVATWLSSSSVLRQRLRRRLLSPSVTYPATFFVEVFLEWEDSSC